jgi:hypothetical protein
MPAPIWTGTLVIFPSDRVLPPLISDMMTLDGVSISRLTSRKKALVATFPTDPVSKMI